VLSVMLLYRIRGELHGAALHAACQRDLLPASQCAASKTVRPVTRRTDNASHSAASSVDISEVKGRILVFYRALLTGRINCSERVYKRESKLASE